MTKIFVSYDHLGFQEALRLSKYNFTPGDSIADQLEALIPDCNYDLFKGHCQSFQIYNEKGEVIFDSAKAAA